MHKICNTFHQAIRNLCEPNPTKNNLDPSARQALWKRNMMNMYILIIVNVLFIISFPFSDYGSVMSIFNVLANLVVLLVFLALCRSYLWVFNLFHTILVSTAAFPLMENAPEIVFFYIGYAFSLPPFILMVSGSVKLAGIAGGVQVFVFATKFKQLFIESIKNQDPQEFGEKFIMATLILFIIMLVAHLFLLRAFDKKNVELVQAKKIAEDALEQQKTFIFSFSHELRNPINSLLGNLQLALLEGNSPGQKKEMINVAKICGEILLQAINNVLDTGKYEIGKLEVNPVSSKIHELFQRTWGIYSELLRQKGLKGQLKIEKTVPAMIKVDTHKINQILLNLIGNSIKFTQKGAINVTIKWLKYGAVYEKCFEPKPYDDVDEGLFEKDDKLEGMIGGNSESRSNYLVINNERRQFNYDEIEYPVEEIKGVLKIIVKDTGCGMKKESLGKLFKKFSQVSDNVSQRQIGTGLGLFITKEICRAMKGDVRAYSKENVGTTFIVCIPVVTVPMNNGLQKADNDLMVSRLKEKKIKAMVVDDSPFNVSLTCNYLTKIGGTVVSVAYNGYEAYSKYKESKKAGLEIDVITLDIDMPIMNGKVVCERIRQYEKENKLKSAFIVLISGNYDKEQVRDFVGRSNGEERKADYFLKKPVSVEDFTMAMYHLLHLEQQGQEEGNKKSPKK